eukprot:TRINITY_DN18508_c0_g1_i5.p1 TRINITY_DN18508_c0_g1~~TRINITY_DN18508_c0_g1_i5.p1  ORF type:complete len:111 (-),score=11.01 TRINITY_DN18508_c0_g1_i5:3828-4160(-)
MDVSFLPSFPPQTPLLAPLKVYAHREEIPPPTVTLHLHLLRYWILIPNHYQALPLPPQYYVDPLVYLSLLANMVSQYYSLLWILSPFLPLFYRQLRKPIGKRLWLTIISP